MHLVIVESPTKAKTIRKFLGNDYTVVASMGHVRDLPETAADIPAEYKKTTAGQLGVDVDHDFQPIYVVSKNKTKVVTELKKLIKDAEDVYLATDEDREGESISWHLLQLLKPKIPVKRMVFHEITKGAIEQALAHPRDIDERLVRAQETRRVLDRLVGYLISPILWKKIAYGLSAGRVQSAALKSIVDRERARMAFRQAAYWDVRAEVQKGPDAFEARLIETGGNTVATGKDFDEQTGALKEGTHRIVVDEARAKSIAEAVKTHPWTVSDVQERPVTRRPSPPFITSTFQQEANRKLGLSSKEAMRAAQSLYEKGFITYMRTDSVSLSQDAIAGARRFIGRYFGESYVPASPRYYESKSKGAQEAHEAIRPSLNFTPPDETGLAGAEKDVYELIWMRTLASQMPDSKGLQVTAKLRTGSHLFQANGMTILEPGFLRAYQEASDESDAVAEKERPLPALAVHETVICNTAEPQNHETKPPARFTEAGLIQFMEKEGIGRPSTYATVISTLLDRGYVRKQSSALVPTFTGFAVAQFMERHFAKFVDVGFTSTMEASLDAIADGSKLWLPYLRELYDGPEGLAAQVKEKTASADAEEARTVIVPTAPNVPVRIGRFGPYFETIHPRSGTEAKGSVPEEIAPADFTTDTVHKLLEKVNQGPTTLGDDPKTGLPIFLKTGAFGPYLQLGEDPTDPKQKPKRVSIPKEIPLTELDSAKAIALVSLPRTLGTHPETGESITAGLGRFGPYVKHGSDFRSLKKEDNIFTIELPRALELLAMPKGGRGGKQLRTIGDHPDDGKPITLHEGKFGVYVKHGKTNATLQKGMDPATLTLEQATALLAEKKTTKRAKTTRRKA